MPAWKLLPCRWVVERHPRHTQPACRPGFAVQRWACFAWLTRFRWLARGYERLPETLAGLHLPAFAILLLKRCILRLRQRALHALGC